MGGCFRTVHPGESHILFIVVCLNRDWIIVSFKEASSWCCIGKKLANLRCITNQFGTGHVICCGILVLDPTLHLTHNVCSSIMGRNLFVLLMSLGRLMHSGTFKYVVWCYYFILMYRKWHCCSRNSQRAGNHSHSLYMPTRPSCQHLAARKGIQ